MAGTKEGGEKAATRGHESLSKAGEAGGHARSGKQSMETRAQHEGKSVHDAASEMGRKGGEQSHGGGRGKATTDEEE